MQRFTHTALFLQKPLEYYTEICYIDLVNSHKRHNKKTYSDSPQKAVAYFYVKEKKKARKTL